MEGKCNHILISKIKEKIKRYLKRLPTPMEENAERLYRPKDQGACY